MFSGSPLPPLLPAHAAAPEDVVLQQFLEGVEEQQAPKTLIVELILGRCIDHLHMALPRTKKVCTIPHRCRPWLYRPACSTI